MKIQWKLLVVLLLPLVALAALVGAEVLDRRAEALDARQTRDVIELVGVGNDLRDGVQLQVALAALPQTNDVARRLRTSQLETEADIRAFNATLADLDVDAYGPGLAAAVDDVRTALRNYEAAAPSARTDGELPGALTRALVDDLGRAAARAVTNDGELARATLGYTSLLAANARTSDLFHQLTQALSAGPVTRASLRAITSQRAEAETAFAIFRSTATSGQRADLARVGKDGIAATAVETVDAIERTEVGTPIVVDTTAFVPAMERRIRLLESVARAVGRDIETHATSTSETAERSALVYLAVGIAAVLVAFGLAVAFLVSIVRRLNQLALGVRYFAQRQLPALVESLHDPGATEDAIGETLLLERLGNDEIGDVGRAFNTVQGTFAEVAREHAALLRKGIGDIFVRLARRNQSLVERQIELLDELEAAEKDPDVLENLFKLDHLATRVRRNGESLLVLAGSAPSRTWSDPVPLDELLQGATAEIEDYRRIRVGSGSSGDAVAVLGSASLDVAHLFAELLDNAVRFSPPDTSVEILARRRGETCVVYVTDTGMGMSDEQLAEANELLESPPEPGLDLSRTLGLYVAARLAARHDVTVRLARSAYDGIVASVTLPASLLVDLEAPEATPSPLARNGHADEAHEMPRAIPTRADASTAVPEPYPDEPTFVPEPLPQRVHATSETVVAAPDSPATFGDHGHGAVASPRTPDERRAQLSSFLQRLQEGKTGAGRDADVTEESFS